MSKLAAAGDRSTTSPGWAISRGDGHRLVHRRGAPHRHAVGDQRLELVGGLADQHERADARRDRLGECGVVEALVLAAGDEHDRGIEGLERRRSPPAGSWPASRSPSARRPARRPSRADAGRRRTCAPTVADRAGVDADQARRERGAEDVGEHVAAGQRAPRRRQTTRSPPTVSQPSSSQASSCPRPRPLHAVPRQRRGWQPLAELAAAGVVVVQHDPPVRRGQLGKPRLHRPVRLDGAVAVQVVLGDVRVQRDVDAAADRRQLQLGELEHDPVVRPELDRPLDERRADVPAQDASGARPRSSIAASSEAVVVLPFVPVTPATRARVRRRKRSTSLTTWAPRASAARERLAQPRVGRREARPRPTGWSPAARRARGGARASASSTPSARRTGRAPRAAIASAELGGGSAVVGGRRRRRHRPGSGWRRRRIGPGRARRRGARAGPRRSGSAVVGVGHHRSI